MCYNLQQNTGSIYHIFPPKNCQINFTTSYLILTYYVARSNFQTISLRPTEVPFFTVNTLHLRKTEQNKLSLHSPSSMRLWLKSPGWPGSTTWLASSHSRSVTTCSEQSRPWATYIEKLTVAEAGWHLYTVPYSVVTLWVVRRQPNIDTREEPSAQYPPPSSPVRILSRLPESWCPPRCPHPFLLTWELVSALMSASFPAYLGAGVHPDVRILSRLPES